MTLVSSPVDDLAERFFTATLERDPLTASVIGRHEYDDRLPDLSPEAAAAQRRTFEALRSEAEELSPDPNEPEEALVVGARVVRQAQQLTSPRILDRIRNVRRDVKDHLTLPDVADFAHSLRRIIAPAAS